jgi:hypothetical protein
VQDEVTAAFTGAEGRLDSLVLALVGTRFFRERGGAVTDDPGPETGGDTGSDTGSDDSGTGTTGGSNTGGDNTGGDTGEQPGPMTTPGIEAAMVQDSMWKEGECNTSPSPTRRTHRSPGKRASPSKAPSSTHGTPSTRPSRAASCSAVSPTTPWSPQDLDQLRLLPPLLKPMHLPLRTALAASTLLACTPTAATSTSTEADSTGAATTTTGEEPTTTPGRDRHARAGHDLVHEHHRPGHDLDHRPDHEHEHQHQHDHERRATTTTGAVGCADLPLCEDFESAAADGPPDPALWTVTSPNCAGSGSLHVTTGAGPQRRALAARRRRRWVLRSRVHRPHRRAHRPDRAGPRPLLRAPRRPARPGHTTFMTLRDAADNAKDLRMGGQNEILMWNRESDDATLPSLSPAGIALSTKPAAQQWTCVEFVIDQTQGGLVTRVDGVEIPGLHVRRRADPDVDQQWLNKPDWKPALEDIKFGWESYAGQTMVLYFDDIALADAPIGCD